ncbi:MAG: sporulation protein YqfD [Oscillospiraceae bacterium]|nr:sporulation protein YqfD [Oscillospiraceae bacterium]
MIENILFRAEGGDIAAFLNLAAENDLTIQKFCKADSLCFGYLPPAEYRAAARLARQSGVRLQILEKNGVSFALRRYRRRLGLVFWPVLCTAALLFSQNFLWAVDVTGCTALNEAVIRTEAETLGLRTGVYLPRTDLSAIAGELRKVSPLIATLSLNRVGSRVEITLTEAALAPDILPDDPCNMIAARTGRITSLSVTGGQPAVSTGQTVAEGQLLISGVTESPDGKQNFVHASGEVLAEALFTETFTLPLTRTEQLFTGEEKTFRSLDLFGKKIPLFLPEEDAPSVSSRTLAPLTLAGIELPLGIETETRRYYTESEKTFTEEEALALLQKAAADFEANDLAASEVLSKEESASVSGGVMTLQVTWTAIADIARPVPIEIAGETVNFAG